MSVAVVAGTFDTKADELGYIAALLRSTGVTVRTVDLGTSGALSVADIPASSVAACHPGGVAAVLGQTDRGVAVTAMAEAFAAFVADATWIGGMIGAGGSGGTALVAPAMRALAVGVPKVLVSTVASGNVAPYVGPSDIMMMYSVTDVQGLNRISRRGAGQRGPCAGGHDADRAGRGCAGQARRRPDHVRRDHDCRVSHIAGALAATHDPLVFHATGTGGQSMEKLVESGMIGGVLDLTTTEIADMLVGGVFPATGDRMGAIVRSGIPYVGSVGALDMVNFGARETVPERFSDRLFHVHNPQVTLMRTTAAENRTFGKWIAERLNLMTGPVRFLLPEGGVSAIDAEGQVFHDPDADAALFEAIESAVRQTETRRVLRVPYNLNTIDFAEVALQQFREISDAPH